MGEKTVKSLRLPETIVGLQDLIGLKREIDALLEQRVQARVADRDAGVERQVSSYSVSLQELLSANGLDDSDNTFKQIQQQISDLRSKAPRIRISLAAEPKKEAVVKLVSWFRQQIDPTVLIQVGIQPSIAGGAVLQTGKRRYDWGLRSKLDSSSKKFVEILNHGQ